MLWGKERYCRKGLASLKELEDKMIKCIITYQLETTETFTVENWVYQLGTYKLILSKSNSCWFLEIENKAFYKIWVWKRKRI